MPPQFYISGSQINRPEALRRLPLDLFRSQDYPGQPDTMGDASERFLTGNEPPIYVPDRMMYTRWTQKRDIFGANTVAMLSALKQAQDVQTDLQGFSMAQAGNVPVGQSFYDSADDITGSRLPTLNRLSQQDYERTPLARNAIPISGFVDSDAAKSALGLQGVRGLGARWDGAEFPSKWRTVTGTPPQYGIPEPSGVYGLRGAQGVDARWVVPVILGCAAIFLLWESTPKRKRR